MLTSSTRRKTKSSPTKPTKPTKKRSAEKPVFYRGIRLFLHKYGRHWPIVVVLLGTGILCRIFIEPGHDWGDDFALYINQARGIAEGNVGEVVANNRYSINNSGWNSFSPLVYPWGFPLMLAPVIALWGVDYAKLKLVTVFSFLGFLACMYRLIETRRALARDAYLRLVRHVDHVRRLDEPSSLRVPVRVRLRACPRVDGPRPKTRPDRRRQTRRPRHPRSPRRVVVQHATRRPGARREPCRDARCAPRPAHLALVHEG